MAKYDSKAVPPRVQNLIGETYGRLTVVGYSHAVKRRDRKAYLHYWLCRCKCGVEKPILSSNLTTNKIVSCGCYKNELQTIHGHAKRNEQTKAHRAWMHMKDRCNNPNHPAYEHYGGRGITVCDEWQNSFEAFLDDVGRAPNGDLTLERINNELGYEQGNVKWATMAEQNRNKRNNVMLTHGGKTMTLTDWAKSIGMNKGTLRGRIRSGWSVERALTEPVG